MSGAPAVLPEPITAKRLLVEFIAEGCKPRSEWRIGTEHEKFVFRRDDLRPVPYEGARGIGAFLQGLQRYGWEGVTENGRIVALTQGRSAITLEPGGQLELSGAPLQSIHQTCDEVHQHLRQAKAVAHDLDVALIGLGYQPKWPRAQAPWMPRGRYAIVRNYLPRRGDHALDMMQQTCSVQVNLDYADEADMVKKFRVGLALQPIAAALFARSPFKNGTASGYLSYRNYVWTDTDPDRCGLLPFVFEAGMGFERYVDYVLDVPMFFVYRNGRYIDAAGLSFRDFLKRKLAVLPGELPTLGDWSDHLTTIYTDVRMKRFLEMRGADAGPWQSICALPAFWTGLLYDDDALDGAWDLVKHWRAHTHEELRRNVPRYALQTPWRGHTVRDFAMEAVRMSRHGLARRARLNGNGHDESHFLDELSEIAESRVTPAETLLHGYNGRWNKRVDPLFTELAY